MATANAQHLAAPGSGSSFFSRLRDVLATGSGIVDQVGVLWNNVSPIWSGSPPPNGQQTAPTYQGPTTGSNVVPTTGGKLEANNMMPIIVIGGAIAAIVLLK